MSMDQISESAEDVWDLDEENGQHSLAVRDFPRNWELEREWKSRHTLFHTLGYRDGIEAGKNSSMQGGTDTGLKEGMGAGFKWGLAKGWMIAFEALPDGAKRLLLNEDRAKDQMDVLSAAVSSISSDNAFSLFSEHLERVDSSQVQKISSTSQVANDCNTSGEFSFDGRLLDCELTPLAAPLSSRLEDLQTELQKVLESACIKLSTFSVSG
eukprot:c25339_g1_i1 orf=362-994(+)